MSPVRARLAGGDRAGPPGPGNPLKITLTWGLVTTRRGHLYPPAPPQRFQTISAGQGHNAARCRRCTPEGGGVCVGKKPDTPCSCCGRLLYSTNGSLPAGQRMCRLCRRQRRESFGVRKWRPPRVCEWCGTLYFPSKQTVRTCSPSCGRKLSLASAPPPAPEAIEARHAQQRERWQQANRRRRALKRRVGSEPYTLAEIVVRDNSRCGLCGRKVRLSYKAPHPLSPTIDHVVPLAAGGDDTRANVQLAHFGCNSRKGTGGSQQLALIG
ncbi:HNH endonuclease [Longimycelium tulufanense]|uniref:HNH endonuclease n=1 Tax=Longimycelium tulufanense TaxID=907463 RepID=UPI0027E54C42|nr:HNH endonuclease signature motif containing protein [Longimycelium tulufanense]